MKFQIKENDSLYCLKAFKNLKVGDVVTVASVTKDGLFLNEETEFFYPEKLFSPTLIDDHISLTDLSQ